MYSSRRHFIKIGTAIATAPFIFSEARSSNHNSNDATFLRLVNSGNGAISQLGPRIVGIYAVNAVELTFGISPFLYTKYKNIRPTQWAGPQSVWIIRGAPIINKWELVHTENGGPDDPEPGFIRISPLSITFYDSPGPNLGLYQQKYGPSMIYTVQNFTAWIFGEPVTGGPPANLCAPVSWYSIVYCANQNWQNPKQSAAWNIVGGSRSGLGWAETRRAPW